MPSIYESQYYKARGEKRRGERTTKGEIIELQTKHWDEIQACLEEDENYQLFKKKREEYFQKQNPDFNDEKRNRFMLYVL